MNLHDVVSVLFLNKIQVLNVLLQVIPLCWCLMETKSQDAYESILLLLRAHLGQWRFSKVVSDFEDAIINAFTNVFGVVVQGCLFHAADVSLLQKTYLNLLIFLFTF